MRTNTSGITRKIENKFTIIRTLIGIGISLVIAFLLIWSVSDAPFQAMFDFIIGPFTSIKRIGYIVEKAIPLIFTGTAVCIMFSCGQINLGAEGAFFISGVVCAALASEVSMGYGLHPLVCIVVSGMAGAIVCVIPAILNIRFDAMTIVSSLMLNFLCLHMGTYTIQYILKDPAAGFNASGKYAPTAVLPQLFSKTNIHFGVIIAIAVVVAGTLALNKSTWGYEIRTVGKNPQFAKFSGINVSRAILTASLAGGFLAGMGGAVEQLGMYNRFSYQGLSSHGWDGIMIAVLAQNNPKLVPLAVLFLAYIRTGADVVNRASDVPIEIIKVVQSVIIIFVAAESFLAMWKHREIVSASKEAELAKQTTV